MNNHCNRDEGRSRNDDNYNYKTKCNYKYI